MFPEHRDLISELKTKDAHFLKMFNKHNELDDEIKALEQHAASDLTPEVKVLKQQKLHIKEELHQILQTHLK
ncbi:YdcH family protein [Shewanella colwelliana]|uniref:YdcH family protein n=1 Tax=Shewanella colwelliana TaxID=23 RepID=UPI0022AEF687|nr:YdcH family protein [Shewanella colwelliana]MCZ4337293.1 YdcH family protein [Shewanella colwelliana]